MRLAAPLAIMLALGASCLPAAAAGVLDRIKESGTVHFGYREDAAPLSYLDENKKPAGYSVLICDAVAASLATQLGTEPLKIEWLPVTTTDRFEAVASGKIDLLCGAATITLTRRETVDFSLPTFVDGAAVMLPRDADPEFDALAGKNIGVRSGTSTEEVLRNTIEAKGMQATVVTFEAHDAALAALEAGEIDAYFGDQSILFGLFFASDLSGVAGRLRKHPDRGEARARPAARRHRLPPRGRPGGERALPLRQDRGILQDRLPRRHAGPGAAGTLPAGSGHALSPGESPPAVAGRRPVPNADRLREQRRLDVAARGDTDHGVARRFAAAKERRRQRHRPAGLQHDLRWGKASAIASQRLLVDTTSPGPASRCSTGKVSAPGRGVRIASQIEPVGGAFPSRSPAASERAMSSKPAGSAVRTRRPGASASSASAIPALRPPPPQQTSTSAASTPASAACAAISSPIGALPGDHLRVVEGRDQAHPARRRRSPPPRRHGPGAPDRTAPPRRPAPSSPRSSPPARPSGIRITAGAPCAAAAQATPWAWLPDE